MTDLRPDAPTSLPERILAEQLRLILAQTPQGVAAPAALMVTTAVLTFPGVHAGAFVAALAGLLAAFSWWIRLYRRFGREGIAPSQAKAWLERATFATAAHGAAWGFFSLVIFPTESTTYQSLVVAFMYGLTAGAVVVDTPHFRLFGTFALPTLLPVVLRCFAQATPTSVGIGVAGLVGLGQSLFAAASSARISRASIQAQFEKQDLVGQLQREREVAEAARAEAEAASRAKSRFLAVASHDLRQPVHALSLFGGAIERATSDAERLHIARRIGSGIEALSAAFDALLEISRLDAGVLQPERRSVGLESLLLRLGAEADEAARAKQLRFACFAKDVRVLTDPVLLERILRNLLDNAVRHTARGGVILAARLRGDLVRVEVWDSGVGIAPEHQRQVFEEFFRVRGAQQDERGVGLGLSIVKRTAALLGHPLTLHSRPGRGTRFCIELPRTAAQEDSTAGGHTDVAGELMGCVIVVIDDAPEALAAMELILQQLGARVIAAESSADALRQLGASDLVPELVVSDYRLGGAENGIGAIAALRGHFGKSLPGVLVTGDTAIDDLLEVNQSGFPVVHKPASAAHLSQTLSAALGPPS